MSVYGKSDIMNVLYVARVFVDFTQEFVKVMFRTLTDNLMSYKWLIIFVLTVGQE